MARSNNIVVAIDPCGNIACNYFTLPHTHHFHRHFLKLSDLP